MAVELGLGPRLEAVFAAEVASEEYQKNQMIVGRGSNPFGGIYVQQGLIGVFAPTSDGEEVLIAPLVNGLLVGAMLDRNFTFEFTLRALSNARVGRIPENRLRALLDDREFAIWCSRNQHQCLLALTGFMSSAAQRTTDRKILNFVQTYLERTLRRPLGAIEKADWLITQLHLSEMLGVTRTHLNARLSALAEQGILDIRRRQIFYRRPQAGYSGAGEAGHSLTIS